MTREGDDRLGHRIRFQGALGGQALDAVEFMVPEDGVLRVVGSLEEEPHQLGLVALRRLDAGDAAGARQWLDWALDHSWSAGQVDDPFTADASPTSGPRRAARIPR